MLEKGYVEASKATYHQKINKKNQQPQQEQQQY